MAYDTAIVVIVADKTVGMDVDSTTMVEGSSGGQEQCSMSCHQQEADSNNRSMRWQGHPC